MKSMIARLLGVLVLVGVCFAALAQQYRWVDEKGHVHYSDVPPPSSAREVQKKNLRGNAVAPQQSYALGRATREAPVTLYTHPICKEQCRLARDVLHARAVPFSEVVANDPDKVEQLKQISGGEVVPILVVGKQVVKTVSAAAYNQALDAAGYPGGPVPALSR